MTLTSILNFKKKYLFKYILKNNLLPIYTRAILETSEDRKQFLERNGIVAYVNNFSLERAFHWDSTKEGNNFWYKHYRQFNSESTNEYNKYRKIMLGR